MIFKAEFQEDAYCIDGSSVLHIIASSDTAADAHHHFSFAITLRSTNGVYTYTWPEVLLPSGQKTVTIPFVVPLTWANDATRNDFLDWHGDVSVAMEVSYVLYMGTSSYDMQYQAMGARLNVTVKDTIVPSVGALQYEAVDEKVPDAWETLVQGMSVVRVSAPFAMGAYSATIERYYFNGGKAQLENYAEIPLQASGDTTVSVTVEDSRGRIATSDLVLHVQPYDAPSFTDVSSMRCTQQGEESEEGTCFLAKGTLHAYLLSGHNPTSVTVSWKKVTEETYGESVAVQGETQIVAANLEAGASYDVKYTVTDAFYTIDVYDYVSSTVYLLHFLKGGKGIAVGKAAEEESVFDVAFDTELRRDLVVSGDCTLSGALTLGGTNVQALLQTLAAPTQTTFTLNTALFSPADVTINQIVRCGRQVVYQFDGLFNADPLPAANQTIVLGHIPSGWFSPSCLPIFTVVQNGVNLCSAQVTALGEVRVTLSQSWQQNLVLTGTSMIVE